jgi:mRNA degradation ribonuclease J1/J2
MAAAASERAAYENTLKIAEKAIAQQQTLISTYESAIKTLMTMVDMAMRRIEVLERKVDAANSRAAKLGVILTILGVVAAVVKR